MIELKRILPFLGFTLGAVLLVSGFLSSSATREAEFKIGQPILKYAEELEKQTDLGERIESSVDNPIL